MKNKSMAYQVKQELREQLCFGKSKHEYKQMFDNFNGVIFSKETYKTYLREDIYFAKWAKEMHGCKDLHSAKKYATEYLLESIDKGNSAWTVHMQANAIAKLYRCHVPDFDLQLPKRQRSLIKRSRTETKGFSVERNQKLVDFCMGTGLRRHELLALRPQDLIMTKESTYIFVQQGKGGKTRYAYVLPEYRERVIGCFESPFSNQKVFGKMEIKVRMPIHYYRAQYAQNYYSRLARSQDQIPRTDCYYCRKDKKGQVYDKQALLQVSRSLGHNRCDVVVNNYFY